MPPVHHQALPAGYRLHWYAIESVLGQGGFGITYLATDVNLQQKVAIKEFLPTELATRTADSTVHPIHEGHSDTYGWGLNRFLTEARTLAQFEHPNIVRVLAVFEANNTAYMVMRYEEGRSLDDALKFRRIDGEAALRAVLMPLLDGLERVHERGFIHRDIKPANIFIRSGDDGSPVLIDFGSARQALGAETRTLTALVSPGYAPFEQYNATAESDRQGPWTDIYALGATLYRAATGKGPTDAMVRVSGVLEGRDPLKSLREIAPPGYSASFLAAVDAALAFQPDRRPQSIAAWRAMFDAPAVTPAAASTTSDDAPTTLNPATGPATVEPDHDPDAGPTRILPRGDTGRRESAPAAPAAAAASGGRRGLLVGAGLAFAAAAVGAWLLLAPGPASPPSTTAGSGQPVATTAPIPAEATAAQAAAEEAAKRQAELAAQAAAEEEAKRQAELAAQAAAEEEAKRQAELATQAAAEEAAKRQAELAAQAAAEEEAKRQAELATRAAAEEEAKRQAELAARAAEEEAKRQAELAAQAAAEEEAKRQAELAARAAEEEAKRQAELAARAAEEEAKRQAELAARAAEEEAKRQAELAARAAAEEEAKRQAELAARAAEEEAKRQAELAARAAEEEAKRQAELAARAAEEEAKRQAELAGQGAEATDAARRSALLDAADADIAALRLTSPPGNNALEKLREVLAAAPDDTRALAALDGIVGRYVTLAEDAAAAGRFEHAGEYLDRADGVLPGAERVLFARETLEQRIAATREPVSPTPAAPSSATVTAPTTPTPTPAATRHTPRVALVPILAMVSFDESVERELANATERALQAAGPHEVVYWPGRAPPGAPDMRPASLWSKDIVDPVPDLGALAATARLIGADRLVVLAYNTKWTGRANVAVHLYVFDTASGAVRGGRFNANAAADELRSLLSGGAALAPAPAADLPMPAVASVLAAPPQGIGDTNAAAPSAGTSRVLAVMPFRKLGAFGAGPDAGRDLMQAIRFATASLPGARIGTTYLGASALTPAEVADGALWKDGSGDPEPRLDGLRAAALPSGADTVVLVSARPLRNTRNTGRFPLTVYVYDLRNDRLLDDSGENTDLQAMLERLLKTL